jgi:hypothetical protein
MAVEEEKTKMQEWIHIDSLYDREFIPRQSQEIRRGVHIHSGALILTPLIADKIKVEGPAALYGAVYCREGLHIQLRSDGPVIMQSVVAAKQGIYTFGEPGSTISQGFFAGSDLAAAEISLSGAIIQGNIYGRNVRLEHCTVFGAVFAEENLSLSHTSLLSFMAREVDIGAKVMLWIPYGLAETRLQLAETVQCLAFDSVELWGKYLQSANLRLAALLPDITRLRLQPADPPRRLHMAPGTNIPLPRPALKECRIRLSQADVFSYEIPDRSRLGRRSYQILTMAPRLAPQEDLLAILGENRNFLIQMLRKLKSPRPASA